MPAQSYLSHLLDGLLEDSLSSNMNKKFSIELCSDLDVEGMVVDISYDMTTIASVNYEKGVDKMEIALLPFDNEVTAFKFPLQDFILVLEKAKNLAIQCAKDDQQREKEW